MTTYCTNCPSVAHRVVMSNDEKDVYPLCERCWDAFTLGQCMADADTWSSEDFINYVEDIADDMDMSLWTGQAEYIVENMHRFDSIHHAIRVVAKDQAAAEADAQMDLMMDR